MICEGLARWCGHFCAGALTSIVTCAAAKLAVDGLEQTYEMSGIGMELELRGLDTAIDKFCRSAVDMLSKFRLTCDSSEGERCSWNKHNK